MPSLDQLSAILAAACALSAAKGHAADPGPPQAKEFALVFSVGYGTKDHMPKDPAEFEKLLVNLKDAGYNAIHCVYKDWRLPLCRKHGVRMMIDVLAHGDDATRSVSVARAIRCSCNPATSSRV